MNKLESQWGWSSHVTICYLQLNLIVRFTPSNQQNVHKVMLVMCMECCQNRTFKREWWASRGSLTSLRGLEHDLGSCRSWRRGNARKWVRFPAPPTPHSHSFALPRHRFVQRLSIIFGVDVKQQREPQPIHHPRHLNALTSDVKYRIQQVIEVLFHFSSQPPH